MKDIITYISNLAAFRVEAEEVCQTKGAPNEHPAAIFLSKDGDTILFNANKIPVQYGDNKSLCLVRTEHHSDLDGTLENMEIIGECINGEYVFRDGGRDKYESTYSTKPYDIEVSGETLTVTPPYMIGVFY